MPIHPLFAAHFCAKSPIDVQAAYRQYFKGEPPSVWHCTVALNDAGLTETILGTAKDVETPVSYVPGANNTVGRMIDPYER